MSFLKRLFENPITRKRRELFTSAAAELGLDSVDAPGDCLEELRPYVTLSHNRLKKQQVFSCWRSKTAPAYRLVDLGVVSARGGAQWTAVFFTPELPAAPDFSLSGRDYLHRLSAKVGRTPGLALDAPAAFLEQFLVQGADEKRIAAFLTPQRLAGLRELHLPKISTIEVYHQRLLYHQSLNQQAGNPTDFDPRQAQPAHINQIVREGIAVFNLLSG